MDVVLSVFFTLFLVKVYCVPPDICFQKFKWQDCGMNPKAVIYYYASGSRCEVGMWRGCAPNPNMFDDEYKCVQTCIFPLRARPEDYHHLDQGDNDGNEENMSETTTMTDDGLETTTGQDVTSGDDDATTAEGEDKEATSAEAKTEAAAPAESEAKKETPAKGEGEAEAPAEGETTPAQK